MAATASSSSLESLIHSLIPQSRSDQVLFNDLLSHCKDVLSRLATIVTCSSLSLTRQLEICSHIGQSREKDIGHLSDIVKRRRTCLKVLIGSPPNLSARLSRSESS